MSVADGVERDLKALPEALRSSGLAEVARVLAGLLDAERPSLAQKALAAKELRETLAQLRGLAPVKVEDDEIERARKRREARLEGKPAAGSAAPS